MLQTSATIKLNTVDIAFEIRVRMKKEEKAEA